MDANVTLPSESAAPRGLRQIFRLKELKYFCHRGGGEGLHRLGYGVCLCMFTTTVIKGTRNKMANVRRSLPLAE